jgi:two-component system sensor histidine kinase QseC
MEGVATGLLALARCEGSLLNVNRERVALAALCEEVSQSFAVRVREKELTFAVDVPKETCWYTDSSALRSILTNLFSNAVDHSQPASNVKIQAATNGAGACLMISNVNRSLVAEDVPHLFERFWQKDAARSSTIHYGLGLPLARAYAHSLGIKLDAELKQSEIVFTLSGAISCNDALFRARDGASILLL